MEIKMTFADLFVTRAIQLTRDGKPKDVATKLATEEFIYKIFNSDSEGKSFAFIDKSTCKEERNGWIVQYAI